MTVVVFGSVNADLIFPLPELPRPGQTVLGSSMRIEAGGKGANQAVAAARDGADVILAGAVGTDALADDALALVRQAGIDLNRVAKIPGATGCAVICVDPQGRNQIAVASAANAHADQSAVEEALLGRQTVLLLQMETPPGQTEALIRRARAAGSRIVLNLAPAGRLPRDVLAMVDILVVNQEEAAWLAADLGCAADAGALHVALGVSVVTTFGDEGLAVVTRDGRFHLPAHAIGAVDTTAAGDCLCGVLAAGLDRGMALMDAVARANAAAALACTRAGSQSSLPTTQDIDRFLAR